MRMQVTFVFSLYNSPLTQDAFTILSTLYIYQLLSHRGASIHVVLTCLLCPVCGLSFHKRCVYKIPNNCSYTRSRRSSSSLTPSLLPPPSNVLPRSSSDSMSCSDESITNSVMRVINCRLQLFQSLSLPLRFSSLLLLPRSAAPLPFSFINSTSPFIGRVVGIEKDLHLKCVCVCLLCVYCRASPTVCLAVAPVRIFKSTADLPLAPAVPFGLRRRWLDGLKSRIHLSFTRTPSRLCAITAANFSRVFSNKDSSAAIAVSTSIASARITFPTIALENLQKNLEANQVRKDTTLSLSFSRDMFCCWNDTCRRRKTVSTLTFFFLYPTRFHRRNGWAATHCRRHRRRQRRWYFYNAQSQYGTTAIFLFLS